MARRDKVKEKSPEGQSESFDLTGGGTDLGGAVAGELLASLIPGPLPWCGPRCWLYADSSVPS